MPRRLHPRVLRSLAALVCLLLAACIDGREEFWIRADGSGRAKVRYEIPKSATLLHGGPSGIRTMMAGFLDANSAVFSSSSHAVTDADGRVTIEVDASFASALDLENLVIPERKVPGPVRHFIGTFKLARDGRDIAFSRTVLPGKALPSSPFIPASRYRDRQLTYIVHLPAPPNSSNATRTENRGATLVWEHPLASVLRQPLVTEFHATAPIPPLWIAAASAAGIAITTLAFFTIRAIFSRRRTRS